MRLVSLMMASLLALSATIVLPSAAAHFCQEGNPRHETPCGECPDGENHEHFHEDGRPSCDSMGPTPEPDPSDPGNCEEKPWWSEIPCEVYDTASGASRMVSGWLQCVYGTTIGQAVKAINCVPPCNSRPCVARVDPVEGIALLA